jgi:hypothetical protein
MPVEFARDVEMQSSEASTTQGSLAAMLTNIEKKYGLEYAYDACVVNTGLHDIVSTVTDLKFTDNVEWYVTKILKPHCMHVLWIDITEPKQDSFAQKAYTVSKWNVMVAERLSRNGGEDGISVLRFSDKSRDAAYEDNIHIQHGWYRHLSRYILERM